IGGTDYYTNYGYDVFGRLAHVEYPESYPTVFNTPPEAVLSAPGEVAMPNHILLDGSESTDDDAYPINPPAFAWSQTAGPGGGAFSYPEPGVAEFIPVVPGRYGFAMEIGDGEDTDTAIVSVDATPSAPAAL